MTGIWDVFIYKTGSQICLQNRGRIVLLMIEAVLLLRFFISILFPRFMPDFYSLESYFFFSAALFKRIIC